MVNSRSSAIAHSRAFRLSLILALASAGALGREAPFPTLRWAHGAAGCTQEQGPDGRYYYRLSTAGYDLVLALDPQELGKIQHRATPMLGVYLTFHNKGNSPLEVQQNRFTLQFVKHFGIVQTSLDPDDLLQHLQQNADALGDEVRREIKKHPDEKEKKEAELQARLKDYTEMMDFISTRALRPSTLGAASDSTAGWVFFGVKNKWIGPWRKPEQFILRLPVQGVVVEFPFSLPPQGGKVELRQRPAQ